MTKTQFHFTLLLALLWAVSLSAQQAGLVGEYFDGTNFNRKVMTRTDAQINFVWDWVAPAPGINPEEFSVRWKGQLKSPETGNFLFSAKVDDGIRVKIGGQLVIDAWGLHDSEGFTGHKTLEAGKLYDIEVEFFNGLREAEIKLLWQLPSKPPKYGGVFGYNYEPISSQYFFQPAAKPVAAAKPNTTPAKPVTPPTPPKKKPVAQPAQAKPKPAQPKPQPKPSVVPTDTLERYIPKNVLFERGKSVILPESFGELDNLAGFLKRNSKLKVSIEGHTDNIGDSAKNLELSEQRAQKVREYLSNKGIDSQRISAKGYGDTRPLVKSQTREGTAKNRRVEFILSY